MANSRTRKKANKAEIIEVKQIIDLASDYVQHWARQETKQLIKKELVILPTRQGYQVGKYSVRHINPEWQVYNLYNELISEFTNKRSAVLWCLLTQLGKLNRSRELLDQDNKVKKLTQDNSNYQHLCARAAKRKDYFTADVFQARISGISYQLTEAKIDLEKTLNSAKYLKGIWEKSL